MQLHERQKKRDSKGRITQISKIKIGECRKQTGEGD